jgi:hypothetical protein
MMLALVRQSEGQFRQQLCRLPMTLVLVRQSEGQFRQQPGRLPMTLALDGRPELETSTLPVSQAVEENLSISHFACRHLVLAVAATFHNRKKMSLQKTSRISEYDRCLSKGRDKTSSEDPSLVAGHESFKCNELICDKTSIRKTKSCQKASFRILINSFQPVF